MRKCKTFFHKLSECNFSVRTPPLHLYWPKTLNVYISYKRCFVCPLLLAQCDRQRGVWVAQTHVATAKKKQRHPQSYARKRTDETNGLVAIAQMQFIFLLAMHGKAYTLNYTHTGYMQNQINSNGICSIFFAVLVYVCLANGVDGHVTKKKPGNDPTTT